MPTIMHRLRHTPLHPRWFAKRHERRRRRMVKRLARGRVLDIGGRYSSKLRSQSPHHYVGLHHPDTAQAEATPHIFGDICALPFQDGAFDTVLMLEVLERLHDPQTAVREATRVLAPNGRLILSTPFPCPSANVAADYRHWTEYGLYVLDTGQET